MTDYPSSVICQVIMRCLNYRGYSKYFTILFDSYDRDCSLIVPYQLCESPRGNVVFELDKHDRAITSVCMGGGTEDAFLFTLSNKMLAYSTLAHYDMGDIKMPDGFDSTGI